MSDVNHPPQSGYTLPVFACAGAIAALRHLSTEYTSPTVTLDLLQPAELAEIPIEQVARLSEYAALAITRSDPGDNLDLTRHTPIWSIVRWAPIEQTAQIVLEGGEGIGRHRQGAAIYAYARELLATNLARELATGQKLRSRSSCPQADSSPCVRLTQPLAWSMASLYWALAASPSR